MGRSEYPLKRIGLNFPVFKDGGEVTELLWDKGNTVDTICWGSRQPRWDFDWDKAQTELAEARRLYGDRLTIRLGAELGEAPMAFDRAEHLLDHAPKLDFVIGSVHMAGKNSDILTCTTLKKIRKRIIMHLSTVIWRMCWSWRSGGGAACWAT